mgnify:CR=1 FL=1
MKKTLLQIVQSILSDMDSENVNSIADSVEALQIASIVEDTFYNIIATREIPEHRELIKLTSLSDPNFPTNFTYPTHVKQIEKVWYDVSTDNSRDYMEIRWVDPLVFIGRSDRIGDNYVTVPDRNAGTSLRIGNDRPPSFYTSFDDFNIVMDSFVQTQETNLQESKVRAYGVVYPVFSQTDSYVPDIDNTMFPYLIAEAKSTAMSLLKGGPDPKVEQAARRQRSYIQNDMFKTKQKNKWSNYGRS